MSCQQRRPAAEPVEAICSVGVYDLVTRKKCWPCTFLQTKDMLNVVFASDNIRCNDGRRAKGLYTSVINTTKMQKIVIKTIHISSDANLDSV